jgi:NAD(P)H-hydrate repair Nnr-like enzyme with NAD(P)H-hydrate dehydratase domain
MLGVRECPTDTSGIESETSNRDAIDLPPTIDAIALASIITRGASYRAYQLRKRSMTSPDVINMIGTSMQAIFPDPDLD